VQTAAGSERGLPLNVKRLALGLLDGGCHLRRVVPYASWSGASPRLPIVVRVASIANGGVATHGTLDTNIVHEHATGELC
jgi:hypothetical protein